MGRDLVIEWSNIACSTLWRNLNSSRDGWYLDKPLATYEPWIVSTPKNSYTAILKQDGDFWIGWVEEVPGVNAQEKTKKELLASLREILQEALEFSPHFQVALGN
jgi:predicted RNase H-like HicB family nuclease